MPNRSPGAKDLADLLGVISHPVRLKIIEELGRGEQDVHSLQEALGLRQPVVSHHLSLLRAYRLVIERREGRHHFYSLRSPALAGWLGNGLRFLDGEAADDSPRTTPRSTSRSTPRRVPSR